MSSTAALPNATFRDPAGSLIFEQDRVLRTILPSAREDVLDFLESPLCARLQQTGDLIAAVINDAASGLTLQHPRVPVPTYPWEWTPSQWLAAADLTLSLAEQALADGWILKDATPLNILFLDARPVFVDILSFERHKPNSSIWLAYGQYMRTFLLPLVMNRLLGWPLALSLFMRDGYEPASLFNTLSWSQRLSPTAFWPITLPALFEKNGDTPPPIAKSSKSDPEFALHLLQKTFKNLRNRTHKALQREKSSNWSQYKLTRSHYTSAQSAQKEEFVRNALEHLRPASVLDIGANTGEHSILAARFGEHVVALERDIAAAERLFRTTQAQQLPIKTIVADLARPTPAVGWRNSESSSLLDRLEGQFDLVMMLAVIHHLILLDQIPIPEILDLCRRLTRRHLLIEWVPVSDPMFQSLMRGRDSLYGALTASDFLEACASHFHLLRSTQLENGRTLFLFEKLTPNGERC